MKARTVLKTVLLAGLAAALLPACGGRREPAAGGAAAPAGPPGARIVFVSILPQVTFVQRVGGDRVQAQALVQPGQAAETFEPTPRQMAGLAEASVYFRIGIPFEEALFERIGRMLPRLTVLDSARGIARRAMEAHADEAEGSPDPHTWLDPRRVEIMAANIRDGLSLVDPQGRAAYEAGCAAFVNGLEALDGRMRGILAPVKGRTLLVFHPAFGYLADAYGLKQEAIQIEGKEPSARQLARLIERARAEQIGAIFVQPQFDRRIAQKVADALGAQLVVLDDLAADYMANMEGMARAIAAALGRQGQGG